MMKFISHRSTFTCLHGCAASTQTLASQIGIDIMKNGGNAADAAVAMAAALNVTEPCSTGIGGDAFCLFYSKEHNSIRGINASGRAPEKLTLEYLNKLSFNNSNKVPALHALSVTVPGACAGWVDCVESFGSGKLSLSQILQPAINLARNGFPVAGPITAKLWQNESESLMQINNEYGKELLVKDELSELYRAPVMGEVFKNPGLANVLESVAINGKDGFYKGWVADAIVELMKKHGGVISHKDLEEHTSSLVDPISIEYKGVKLWEIPPNGQGIVALEALNILNNFEVQKLEHNSADYLHLLIEAVKLSFADALQYCADIDHADVPIHGLLSGEYGKERATLIDNNKAKDVCHPGDPANCLGDTVYFTTADKDGNFCSFINSNYMGFGTGLVPQDCGFSLQNRGFNFSLQEGHPNVVAPGKRPYHTIIPAMVTDASTGELLMSYGVMGGFMQPQGHVQVLLNMLEFGMDPQKALDAPRFLVGSGHNSPLGTVHLEEGIDDHVCDDLAKRGHSVNAGVGGFERKLFGRGQIAARKSFWQGNSSNTSVLWAASDPRGDGVAIGY